MSHTAFIENKYWNVPNSLSKNNTMVDLNLAMSIIDTHISDICSINVSNGYFMFIDISGYIQPMSGGNLFKFCEPHNLISLEIQ